MRRSRKKTLRALGLRRRILLIALLLASLSVFYRAFALQVLEADSWRARAENQQADQVALPAPRGTIYDRDGVPLAASQEAFRISIAPRELRKPTEVTQLLRKHAKLTRAAAQRAVDPARSWIVLPGRYDAPVRQALNGVRGVYFERVLRRVMPRGEIATELLGLISADNRALGGLEQQFDAELRGEPGRAATRRDARGRMIPGAWQEIVEPIPGNDLHLTIDADLQEIAREALGEAVAETGATGGELLLSDPRTGEVLAAVSSRKGPRTWRAVTEPYEPGSTLKPFAIATLVAEKRTYLSERVFAENGAYTRESRTIRDVHAHGWLTVAEALKYSSNIVVAKLSERLDPATQYAYLRAFGFGSPTAVTYPSESSGLLRRPASWTEFSPASLAIGYEISVTPLQMLMAWGALANGGVLMEPRLVREVRARDGRIIQSMPTEAVRRVIPEWIANQLRPVLSEAVSAGTARMAALGSWDVAGKTGTARAAVHGRYQSGAYTSSFAGFFPASNPQLVFLVKLDSPRGEYYGAQTAAPVTRTMLEAALAARSIPLDKRAVATKPPPPLAKAKVETPRSAEPASGPYIFALDAGPPRRIAHRSASSLSSVPDVRGLALRDAVRHLHAKGFRVGLQGRGVIKASNPGAGERVPSGALIRLNAVGQKP
jgi:cell division protein FtsI (penicillin-binding protein 3)